MGDASHALVSALVLFVSELRKEPWGLVGRMGSLVWLDDGGPDAEREAPCSALNDKRDARCRRIEAPAKLPGAPRRSRRSHLGAGKGEDRSRCGVFYADGPYPGPT